MVLSLLVIAITLGLGYAWFARGFYSAMLHLACTVVAGAIAFAAWEPLSLLMVNSIEYKKGVMGFLQGSAWGLGLLLPFVLSLVALRLGTDSLLKANVKLHTVVDRVGGGVCGLAIGTIASGMLVLGTGFMRMPENFQGYQPVQIVSQGNLERTQSLWLPADKIVAGLYATMSKNALSTSDPLARYYPDLVAAAGTQRMSYGSKDKTQARNTMRAEDLALKLRYTVGADGAQPLERLLIDKWSSGVSQTIVDLDGNPFPEGTRLEGYVLEFNSGALEDFGQFVITHPQLRLLAENSEGDIKTIHPIAFVSRTRSGSDDNRRFSISSSGDVVSSVGAASKNAVAFEFPVPSGYEPFALYARNQRLDITGEPGQVFATSNDRDRAVESTALLKGVASAGEGASISTEPEIDTSDSTTASRATGSFGSSDDGGNSGVNISQTTRLPGRIQIQKGQERTLQVNDDKKITGGETRLDRATITARPPPELRVNGFDTLPDAAMVQLEVAGEPEFNKASLLGRSVQTALSVGPPQLVDTNGRRYDCVGFVYRDRDGAEIRYTPSRPLRGLSEGPDLSRARDDQQMWLLFTVDVSVQIDRFVIGNKEIIKLDTPLQIRAPR